MPTNRSPYTPRLALQLDGALVERLAALSQTLGNGGFLQAAFEVLAEVSNADSGGVMRYFVDQRPELAFFRYDPAVRTVVNKDSYREGPYMLDPVYQMFLAGCASGAYRMADYAPDDFYSSEYYRTFFHRTCVVDAIDVIWRIDARRAVAFYLERQTGSPGFAAADLAAVEHLLPLLFSALDRHEQIAQPSVPADSDDLVHRKVESTIAQFGASLLTQRERQVLFYMLSGYSAELTAKRLDSAEGTIRIHRKNIHRKLEIGSQAELFSLFIRCIPFATPDQPSDPLQRYQSKAAGEGAPTIQRA